MRILFLSQLLPLPLDAGPKIRAYYVLRHLAEGGHDVTLACFVRDTDRETDIRELGRLCRTVETVRMSRSRGQDVLDGVRSLWSRSPFLILRDRSPAMDALVARLSERRSWDAVHADQLWMAPYASRCGSAALKVLDQHNAVFRIPARLAANQWNPAAGVFLRAEAARLERFERATLDAFDRVAWVSDVDRAALVDAHAGRLRDVIIPIAVDPTVVRPSAHPRPFRVTFLGGMNWPPNAEGVRWFVRRVWPKVAAVVPDCVFTVIGRGSLPRLRADSRVTVAGYVADPEPYLAETAAFVVPLLTGAGMRVKILDAWCRALPVASTSVGAEGLHAVHGENLLIADEPEVFAAALIHLLRDERDAARIASNGRATVEALYDWAKVYRAWDQIYD